MKAQVCLATVVMKSETKKSQRFALISEVFIQETKLIWIPHSTDNSEEESVAISMILNISCMDFSLIA